MSTPEGVSLLWPPGRVATEPEQRLASEQAADLELDILVNALCFDPSERESVSDILLNLCADPAVVSYRQGILDALLDAPEAVTSALAGLLPRIDRLRQHHLPREKGELLHEVAWRLGELEIFLDCVKDLAGMLDSFPRESLPEGLCLAREAVAGLIGSEEVSRLIAELPGLMAEVRGTRSLTIGINVDQDLQPSSATLLSINSRAFDDRSSTFLARLFGAGQAGHGIAPLHRVLGEPVNPMLQPLFRDLSDALSRSLRPVAAALQRFAGVRTQFLDRWGRELAFYLGAVRLMRRLGRAGLCLCRPSLSAEGCRVDGCWNIVLALKLLAQGHEADLARRIVTNDLAFGPREIAILTGPNQGGKTTYMRSVGLAHVLCQAGLRVPGSAARMTVVDSIHTHFPRGEHGDLDSGRFAEEMRRLRDIFARATPGSLILLNESLTATSARESLELAREVVGALQALGARAVYTTHLYELAAEAESFNRNSAGPGRVTSLVAQAGQKYRIEPGPPAGSSHAREVAARYGVGYAQLVELLRSRRIVP